MPGESEPPEFTYEQAWAYDSDSPDFIRGAEIGELETRLNLQDNADIHMIMRRSNEEMLKRITQGANRSYQTEIIDDVFMGVIIFAAPVHELLEKPE